MVRCFPNRILDAATINRLRHGTYKVVFDGKSYRSAAPQPEIQKQSVKEQKKTSKGGEID